MIDREFINKIRQFKSENGYTLYEMSKIADIQVSTPERWFKTDRINKVYAMVIREKLGIK